MLIAKDPAVIVLSLNDELFLDKGLFMGAIGNLHSF